MKLLSILIVAFSVVVNVSTAALTASTGVSLTAISIDDAYSAVTPSHIDVTTSPGQIFLSYTISNTGLSITLNSVTMDITINGLSVTSEEYTTFVLGSSWSRIGTTTGNAYATGQMNQGGTLVDLGTRVAIDSFLSPGDVWQAKMTYDVQGQGLITSIGTVTYIPEPSVLGLAVITSSLFLLRRRNR